MKRIFFIPAIAVLLFTASCAREAKNETRESKGEAQKAEDVKDAFILEKQEVGLNLDLPAELLAYERAEIHAKVDGYVQSVLADIGDLVKKGQVLARLDAPEMAAQYAEASAKYDEAQAKLLASQDNFERIRRAAQQQGVVAEAELSNAKNRMLGDSAALLSAKSTMEAYGQLQEYLTIRAPFNGQVTTRFVDQGDFTGNAEKSTLFTVENPRKLRLRVHVPESYVSSIPAKETLSFTVDAALNKTFSASLARKSGAISRDTRTELWEYEFDNQSGELKPGMYTMAELHLNRTNNSFVVPLPAVVTSMEKKFVVRIKNGETEWVDVREGISMENGKEVFGDLQEGDTMLVRGTDEIKPGTKVKIKLE
jgi:membrane fusion protein, multidrug efflux system